MRSYDTLGQQLSLEIDRYHVVDSISLKLKYYEIRRIEKVLET